MTAVIVVAAVAGACILALAIRYGRDYLGAWAAVSAREREMAAAARPAPPRPERGPRDEAEALRFQTGTGLGMAVEGDGSGFGIVLEWLVAPSRETEGHGVALTSSGAYAHLGPGVDGGEARWTVATSVKDLAGAAPPEVVSMALRRVGPMQRLGSAGDGDCRGTRPSRDPLGA
jgi:hypothetical protein